MASRLAPGAATADDLENIAALIRYEDGSVGNLLYLTQGGAKVPKEYVEVFGGGITGQLHNFESLVFFDRNGQKKSSMRIDKGQHSQMDAFVRAVRHAGAMPIAPESLLDTTLATLLIEEAARSGTEMRLDQAPAVQDEPADLGSRAGSEDIAA
jgi:hypothetical protein